MNKNSRVIILGGGIAGLSAALVLTRAGREVIVLESQPTVGGLAKTIVCDSFRFDLGGHRFFTTNPGVETFLKKLMGDKLHRVTRWSQIFYKGKYIDYPLKPINAIFGLGIGITLKVIFDYLTEHLKNKLGASSIISLEDWIVSRFGRTLFRLYFKDYSEKVCGLQCSRISSEWGKQRIRGLSLDKAIKRALFKSKDKSLPTLAEEFLYPSLGIGEIAEKMREEIEQKNQILINTRVKQVNHNGLRLESVIAGGQTHDQLFTGEEFVSTIPITSLIKMLSPKPPDEVLEAASKLRYRDLIIVAIMVDRPRGTNQTWIYFPDQEIPFARLHEPTNWSSKMAPEGKTLLVAEYFCFRGDNTWCAQDEHLVDLTITHLMKLGFIDKQEVIRGVVLRVPYAYPLLEVGYRVYYDRICSYLSRFENLHLIGRSGAFQYINMDHVIASGINVAERIIQKTAPTRREELDRLTIIG